MLVCALPMSGFDEVHAVTSLTVTLSICESPEGWRGQVLVEGRLIEIDYQAYPTPDQALESARFLLNGLFPKHHCDGSCHRVSDPRAA